MNRTAGVLLVILLAACGSRTVTVPPPEVPEGPLDPYGDPPDYAGDPFIGFEEIVTLEVPGETVAVEEVIEINEETPNLPFAVQISAAAEEATALRLAETVGTEVDAPVYIDHIGQYWKVRVGAFATREETGELLQQLQEMGFTDAWVVERIP